MSCLACDLASGRRELPGGLIHAWYYWIAEHCVGPLGVGTLIVKPKRHVVHIWDLTANEAEELGNALQQTAAVVAELTKPDQIYVSLWSHAGGVPGHIHFVVQPVTREQREAHAGGVEVQKAMFDAAVQPPRDEVERFAASARTLFGD
jgi:diadenosine tetraphosphate (Ap4A) HIT family hydrolase